MDDEINEVNQSQAEYVSPVPGAKRTITFFNSFEEAELHGLEEMAAHIRRTPGQFRGFEKAHL